MTSRPEETLETRIVSELRALIEGQRVGATFEVAPSSVLCSALELFIPSVLRSDFSEWEGESLDGIFISKGQKVEAYAAELVGTCILITDQTVTPFAIELRLSPTLVRLESLRVRIGQSAGGSLGVSGPPLHSKKAQELLMSVANDTASVAWVYEVVHMPARES